jgi:anti-sigma factor RsiW
MFDYSPGIHEFIADYVDGTMDDVTKKVFKEVLKKDIHLSRYVAEVQLSQNLLRRLSPGLLRRMKHLQKTSA